MALVLVCPDLAFSQNSADNVVMATLSENLEKLGAEMDGLGKVMDGYGRKMEKLWEED